MSRPARNRVPRRGGSGRLYPLFGTALSALYLLPALAARGDRIPSVFPDAWVSIWSLWWTEKFLSGAVPSPYHTELLFAPHGASLFLHNLTESVVLPGALLLRFMSPGAAYGIVCTTLLALNFLSAFLLFRAASGSRSIALWLGLIAAFHPFALGHLAGGHLNLLALAPFNTAALSLVGATKGRGGWLLAASLAILAYTDLYLLYFTALLTFLVSAGFLATRTLTPGAAVRSVVLPAAVGVLAGLPKLIPVALLAFAGTYSRNHDPANHAADLLTFLVPGPTQAAGGLPFFRELLEGVALNRAESGAYLGASVLLVALLSFGKGGREARARSLPFMFAAAVFLLLSLGPTVRAGGEALFPNHLFRGLFGTLPFFPSVPARFVGPAAICLLTAAAFALERVRASRSFIAAVLLSAAEFFPAPLQMSPLPDTAASASLSGNTSVSRILDFGPPELANYRQIAHGKPITGGFLARRPRAPEAALRRNGFVRFVKTGKGTASAEEFRALGVEAVIADRTDPALVSRLDAVSFLRFSAADSSSRVYTAIK